MFHSLGQDWTYVMYDEAIYCKAQLRNQTDFDNDRFEMGGVHRTVNFLGDIGSVIQERYNRPNAGTWSKSGMKVELDANFASSPALSDRLEGSQTQNQTLNGYQFAKPSLGPKA
ncbi:unnamed protein product [Caretta caretta]